MPIGLTLKPPTILIASGARTSIDLEPEPDAVKLQNELKGKVEQIAKDTSKKLLETILDGRKTLEQQL